MKNLQIGKSGIEVPFLGMGTWAIGGGAWWGDNDDSLSVKAIQTAVEQGIQWIDTAPIYGLYHSETVVGEAMKHIDRDKVVLSTKCGLEWRHETPVLHKVVDGVTVYRDLSAQSIIEDVEDSLRRLHTDHLDVLYTHWQSPDFGLYPLEATVEAMMKLKEQGKIRAVEEPMKAAIRAAGADGDSVGGLLETAILGLPAGIGEPYFDSVESKIAHLAFSIPAVKGIEFGTGFDFAGLRGSEANDAFRMTPEGAVVTASNHNAGINGGIANGMPVVFRTVVKPTPSIYKQQDTVDYLAKKNAELSIQGRHDPCIVPRAAIVQTCSAALAVADLLTARYGEAWMTHPTSFRKEDD